MSVVLYELKKFFEQERERWFLWLPVLFAVGILFYFGLTFEPPLWLSLVVIEILIVLAYFWRRNVNRLFFLAGIAVFLLGFVDIQTRAYHISRVPLLEKEETLYLKGYVARSGYNYRGRKYLILDHMQDFDGQNIAGKYRVTLLQPGSFFAGDCVEMVASLRPLMMPEMDGAYQFNRQQFFEGIKATGYSDVSVYPIRCEEINVKSGRFLPWIEKLRAGIVRRINNVLPPSTAGVAAAIVAGERSGISVQQTTEYRDAGLAHFLAISGLHMGMIAGITFLIIRWLLSCFPFIALRYNTKKAAAFFAIIISFIYLLISGWQISTQRAFMMTSLVFVGVLFGRQAISMRMVAWAALFILIFESQVLISPGFQMSFAAVIMLVAFYERYARTFETHAEKNNSSFMWRGIKTVIFYLVGIVVADFIASLATLPFVIYHFNRISVYTSLANFLAGPVIGLWIMPCVLGSLLAMPFGVAQYPLWMLGKGIGIVNSITAYVAHLDHASYQVLSMPSWGLVLIVLGGLWLALWQTKWRHLGWFGIVLGFLSIFVVKTPDVLADNGVKTFAIKDNDGHMVILPNRGNYFTKQMWHEKLALKDLSEKDKEKLRLIYKGDLQDKSWLDLVCDQEMCLYKNKIKLIKSGGLSVSDKDYSDIGALSVFSRDRDFFVVPVSQSVGKRYWNVFDKF